MKGPPLATNILLWAIAGMMLACGCTRTYGVGQPSDEDADNDELTNYDEINIHMTDPNNPDTDGDAYWDGEEVFGHYDPLDALDKPYIGGYGRDACYADYIGDSIGDLNYTDQHGEQVYFRDFCGREIFITSGAEW